MVTFEPHRFRCLWCDAALPLCLRKASSFPCRTSASLIYALTAQPQWCVIDRKGKAFPQGGRPSRTRSVLKEHLAGLMSISFIRSVREQFSLGSFVLQSDQRID